MHFMEVTPTDEMDTLDDGMHSSVYTIDCLHDMFHCKILWELQIIIMKCN